MAIPAVLLGGILGFMSFLAALAVDYSFLAACGFYMCVGFGSALLIMALGWLPVWAHLAETRSA